MITSLLELEELANCKRCDEASIVEELRVCIGSSCTSRGADEIEKSLKTAIEKKDLQGRCRVKGVGCNGLCASGTLVSHYKNSTKENTLYEEITLDDVDALVTSIEKQKNYLSKVCDTNRFRISIDFTTMVSRPIFRCPQCGK